MGNLLTTGVAWLDGQRKAHAAQTVTYTRGETSVSLAVTLGRKAYQIDGGYGAAVWVRSLDIIVSAADLRLGGVAATPEPGDRMRVARGSTVDVYEVMAPGGDMSHYEPADPTRTMWRIHTKHVATEDAG